MWWGTPLVQAPRSAEDFFEFKASPVYISSSRTAITNTEIPLREREKEERNKVTEEGKRTTSHGSNFGKLALTARGTHVQVLPYYAPLHLLR